MRAEFIKLKEYGNEVALNYRGRVVMLAGHLVEIRNHIELCDHIANTRMEVYLLHLAFEYWEKCRLFWIKYKSPMETDEVPTLILKTQKHPNQPEPVQTQALVPTKQPADSPEKSWKMTENDRRFLRSIRIAGDDVPANPDKDKDKSK